MLTDRSVRSLMTCRRGNVERCWAYLINSPRRWHMHKSRLTVEVEELSCLLVDHVSLIRPLDATTLSTAEKSVDISLVRYQTSTHQRLEERMNYFRQSELAFEWIFYTTQIVCCCCCHTRRVQETIEQILPIWKYTLLFEFWLVIFGTEECIVVRWSGRKRDIYFSNRLTYLLCNGAAAKLMILADD